MFTIAQLQVIRRKVDKAVKKADALQHEVNANIAQEAYLAKVRLGETTTRIGYSVLPCRVYKGDYTPIFPASVGPNVAVLVLPKVCAIDAQQARTMAGAA